VTLTVVVAPDSFKGSFTSVTVAQALAGGWRQRRPDDHLLLAPLADGGEGTLVAIAAAGGWEWQEAFVSDPIGRPIAARWLRSDGGTRAVVELAEASGLSRLAIHERDPIRATTLGTGQVLMAVLDAGIRIITLGIGGSATSDGGAGILRALRARIEGVVVDLGGLDPRLSEVDLRIACDVTNPLLGPHGAAATYGPQKGASALQVAELDAELAAYAGGMAAATGRDERDTPGAGAAGGTAFALLSIRDRFRSLELRPGVDLVAEETHLDAKLAGADIVLTGEGRIDAQTAFGKTVLGVARRAAAASVQCFAIGGTVDPAGAAALRALGVEVLAVHKVPVSLSEAIAAGVEPIERCAERIAATVAVRRA
jgi:glycerate kinase